MAIGSGPARAAAEVKLTLSTENGFGRMIVTFVGRLEVPDYSARVINGILILQFGEPVALETRELPIILTDYVTVTRPETDRSVRIALRQGVRVNTMVGAERLVVDFLPPGWTGPLPGLPREVAEELRQRAEAELARQAVVEEKARAEIGNTVVELRVGRAEGFTRIALRWNVPFRASFERTGSDLTLSFNHNAELDLADLKAHLPPMLLGIDSQLGEEGLKVMMTLDPRADVRGFRDGDAYVVDILEGGSVPPSEGLVGLLTQPVGADRVVSRGEGEGEVAVPVGPEAEQGVRPLMPPEPAEPPQAEAGAAGHGEAGHDPAAPVALEGEAPPAAAADASEPVPEARRAEAQASQEETPAADHDMPAADVADAAGAPIREADPPSAPATPAGEAMVSPAGEDMAHAPGEDAAHGADEHAAATEQAATEHAGVADEPVRAAAAPPALPQPAADAQPDDHDAAPVPVEAVARAAPRQEGLAVSAVAADGQTQLTFPFAEPTPAAVFRRGDRLWLVFDTAEPLDISAVAAGLGDRALEIEPLAIEGGQGLLIRLREADLVTATRDGGAWRVTLGPIEGPPMARIALERAARPDGGAELRVAFPDAGTVHQLVDPASGETLFVVTGSGIVRSMAMPHRLVELTVLPTAHGLVVAPVSDQVSVKRVGETIVIGTPGGLVMSGATERAAERSQPAGPARAAFVDLGRWQAVPLGSHTETVERLQEEIATIDDKERPAKRVELAGYLLARELGPESLGLLRLAAQENPALESQTGYRVMMAAGNVLSGRMSEAAQGLAQESLQADPDASVWRVIAAAGLRDWRRAADEAPVALAAMSDYPDFVRQRVLLSAARALLEIGNQEAAEEAMSRRAELGEPEEEIAAWWDVLAGRIAETGGRAEEAEAAYRHAMASPARPAASEAELRLAKLLYNSGTTGRPETIEALETLAVSWRGDATELETLSLLADLDVKEGNYRGAFTAMRGALVTDADSPITIDVQDRMARVFEGLFLEGGADAMAPIDALALYGDFREMTPVGRRGDAMVRRLVDRLIGVDLLDQAAALLQHQVDNRLKGAARAQVAADLAVVFLLDRKPRVALQVLRRTDMAQLPAILDRQRRLVEARALSDAGEAEAAMELLASMAGDDVERMRIDTLWTAHDWSAAAERIEQRFGKRWSDPVPLAETERQDVLRAAIAYANAGDEPSLDRLRRQYGTKMSDSPDAQSFDIVTRPIAAIGSEFRAVVRNVAAIDTMDAFLAGYRARYLTPEAVLEEPAADPGEPAAAGQGA